MRNFFTWCIATILFGLCLLENEARKNAKLLQTENKNYVQPYSGRSEIAVSHNIARKSNYLNDPQLINNDKSISINPDEFVLRDSLSFRSESLKQKSRVL